jgi:hypothetical protein
VSFFLKLCEIALGHANCLGYFLLRQLGVFARSVKPLAEWGSCAHR